MKNVILFSSLVALSGSALAQDVVQRKQPNVILVLTDDQGIGGLSCHDNPYLKTPCIDHFYNESVRMTNFHVSPFSTPTRSAIISGRYPVRNGAWATYKGRDILSHENKTIAEIFREGGYSTAMFGKWHLGDNYPCRPTDCGFQVAIQHLSGGVGELSDYWGNNYFDDTYLVNNQPKQFNGYCTDVWFEQATQYIHQHKDDSSPFFVYLATNAPHSPHYVAEKYSAPYQKLEKEGIVNDAGFYGQIANIDENFGRLDQYLKDNNLEENTIVIFMTDNGAGFRDNTWTYGYRGAKGSKLEGGHRVPFFIRYPKAGIVGGIDNSTMAAHVDIIPTLMALCGVRLPKDNLLDGIDFSTVLLNPVAHIENDRCLYIHHRQDYKQPKDVEESCIIKDSLRLVNGNQLYDISKDRKQQHNIASQHTVVMDRLLEQNERFMNQTKQMPAYRDFVSAVAGTQHQRVIKLTIQHAIGDDRGLWKSEQIAAGIKNKNDGYSVKFATEGRYKISLSRWPRECMGKIWGVPSTNPKNWFKYETIHPEKAKLTINDIPYYKEITQEMSEVSFEVEMKKGKTFIRTDFIEQGNAFGAYYTYIEKVD